MCPIIRPMDTDKLQSGGYDSGLGDEVGPDCDGCWAPPPSTATSPEPPRSLDDPPLSEAYPDFGPIVWSFGSGPNFNLLACDEGPTRSERRDTATFISTPLETIYELPSSSDKKNLGSCRKRFHSSIVDHLRTKLHRRRSYKFEFYNTLRYQKLVRHLLSVPGVSLQDISKRTVQEISVQDIAKRFNSLQV